MQLTAKQEQGLKIVLERYRNKQKYAVISGYAGTGKSTLVKYIIDAIDIDPDFVAYGTFTGKAAQVLMRKGNRNAMTLHKLLYDTQMRKDGTFIFVPKLYIDYKIIVVDQCSMVPMEIVDLLLGHNVFVIFLGDPFQLGPVKDGVDTRENTLLRRPHIMLDEIMRQAQESAIIRASMQIRAGKQLPSLLQTNELLTYPSEALNDTPFMEDVCMWGDEILCATNKMRHNLNNLVRKINGRTDPLPQSGDKVICCHNYWDKISKTTNEALINGTIGYVDNCFSTFKMVPQYFYPGKEIPLISASFTADNGAEFGSILMGRKQFENNERTVDDKSRVRLIKSKYSNSLPYEFEYGYAITTHKAQGSSWGKVLIIEENFPFVKQQHNRHLYTALTRAEDKAIIIKK